MKKGADFMDGCENQFATHCPFRVFMERSPRLRYKDLTA